LVEVYRALKRVRRVAELLGATGWKPSNFLMMVASDPDVPLELQILAAARAAPYAEPRPNQLAPYQIPLARFWTSEQKQDYDARLLDDSAKTLSTTAVSSARRGGRDLSAAL
jgi:hypothetical protein